MFHQTSELQLKPHHLPFKILKKWHDILESLATGDTYSEEPTMYWKRDALTHQAMEKKVVSPLATRLLYDELAFNVSYSFYPATLAEAVNMAAIALKVAKADKGSKSDVSDVFGCSMPPHLESGTWGWRWRRKVWKAYTAIAKVEGDKKAWREKYLGTGRKWNYYGATFFYGGLEHEVPGNPDHVRLFRPTPVLLPVFVRTLPVFFVPRVRFLSLWCSCRLASAIFLAGEGGACCKMGLHVCARGDGVCVYLGAARARGGGGGGGGERECAEREQKLCVGKCV